jgi:hypothetical protein
MQFVAWVTENLARRRSISKRRRSWRSLRGRNVFFLGFHQTFAFARQKPRAVSQSDAQTTRNHYVAMAKRILADNIELQRLRGYPDERLERAASAYLERADGLAPGSGSPLLVNRKHGRNESIKGFVLELAATTKAIFGASLFGTVATLTNVAFDRTDITAGQIRRMIPSHTPCR